ncbi:MAG: prepilin-type N-terminal cleavage/methylation domain-containing protein [Bacteroidales bacterium]|nr:prepilin-type N-terminal cleavage/methylation domain-containing protein [Bacteroidales bacterium]
MLRKGSVVKKMKAFTLTELLVVLVIIGILVLIALPRLMPLISRAKSAEAQVQLGYLHSLQQNYFYMYSSFSTSLNEVGFEQSKLVTDGGTANYRIDIVQAGPDFFTARATAVIDFDRDGVFNIWEIDQDKKLVEVVRD